MMWGYPYFGTMMASMAVWSVVWLAVIGVLIWELVRWLSGRASSPGGPPAGPSASEILRQRYARGELDAATFEQMRDRIEATRRDDRITAPR